MALIANPIEYKKTPNNWLPSYWRSLQVTPLNQKGYCLIKSNLAKYSPNQLGLEIQTRHSDKSGVHPRYRCDSQS